MNEKIKELMLQATRTLEVKHEGYRGKGFTEQIEFFDKEKFAELIVRECMAVGFAAVATVEDGCYAVDVYDRIKEHFGVE